MTILNVSPVFACGVPHLGPGLIALIVAWIAAIPLAVVNAVLTVFKCRSDNARMIHFAILALCAIAFANLYGVFTPGHNEPRFLLTSVVGLPLAIYGQFFGLLLRRAH